MPKKGGHGKQHGKGGKGRSGGKSAGNARALTGPGTGATSYNGPLQMPVRDRDADMIVSRLTFTSTIATDGGGNLAVGYPNNPVAATEWGQYSNLYEEYRTLATRVTYIPNSLNWIQTTDTGRGAPVVWTCDRNAGLSPPPNMQAAFQKANSRLSTTQQRMTYVVRAATAQEMLFIAVASPSATWNTVLNSQGGVASIVLGTVFVEFIVQFRARA